MLWIDSTRITHLVVCDECNLRLGPFLTVLDAQAQKKNHRKSFHENQPKPGRPIQQTDKCWMDECGQPIVYKSLSLCPKHYQKFRRGT